MGLSLAGNCRVQFVNTADPSLHFEHFIPRRSFYIQRYDFNSECSLNFSAIAIFRGSLRYNFTHQIDPVPQRRISVLFRDALQMI